MVYYKRYRAINIYFFIKHLLPFSFLQLEGKSTADDSNRDLVRLKEILFEIQEARDDSQQRGWAIRDDSGALASFLEELLQLLVSGRIDTIGITLINARAFVFC